MGRGFKAVDGIPAQSTFQQSESRDATGLFQLSRIGGRGGVGVHLAGGVTGARASGGRSDGGPCFRRAE